MSFKKWLIIFFATMVVCAGALVGFNVAVDPFGVFGDKIMKWDSYNMTNNPRVAKIPYLEQHHQEYDSYVIGCSKTGGLPIEDLNESFNASFYSMLMYGGDMYDIEKTAEYIISNYRAKNIIINLGLEEAVSYNKEDDPMKGNLHCKVDGSSPLKFYGKYLFANPSYAIDKLVAKGQDSYFPKEFDVFNGDNGNYDKRIRDSEAIGELTPYLAANDNVNGNLGYINELGAKAECLAAIAKIKGLCEEKGINFILIMDPVSAAELSSYSGEDLADYWRDIAGITDFWDFSGYNSLAYESRYFYDIYHYRTNIGAMIIGVMSGDYSGYIPSGFGHYVTAENVEERAATAFVPQEPEDTQLYTENVPVLMYHSVGGEGGYEYARVSPEKFAAQLDALAAAGYNPVAFQDLVNYVDYGTELPENPIVITFDDGYANNYTYAWPILREKGFKATINIIGWSVGEDTHKDTGEAIIPHFSYDQGKEMVDSGVIDIQSHSYDMHQAEEYLPNCRVGVLPEKGESEAEYIEAFKADYERSKQEIQENTGSKVIAFAYPLGEYSRESEALLMEMGNRVTMTINPGTNTIVKGLPQSLYALNRINVTQETEPEDLVSILKGDE